MQKWCPTPVSQNALLVASRPSFLQAIKDSPAKKSKQVTAQKPR
jgi:hypothetical protein